MSCCCQHLKEKDFTSGLALAFSFKMYLFVLDSCFLSVYSKLQSRLRANSLNRLIDRWIDGLSDVNPSDEVMANVLNVSPKTSTPHALSEMAIPEVAHVNYFL